MNYPELLKIAVSAALKAGDKILGIYNTNFTVETKADNTPVTQADKISGKCIAAHLAVTDIPVISEEEEVPDYELRKNWERVWIVDPLDGTKEYVKRNGEFAVNIALIEQGQPVIGVIYAPVLHDIYFAATNVGSFKITQNDVIRELTKKELPDNLFEYAKRLPARKPPTEYTVVVSRSHLSSEVNDHISNLESVYGNVKFINVGSSIKQCWVAEGKAHEYPRFGPTMEWDTAAGQCILEQCGGKLIDYATRKPLRYNKSSMKNSYFIALNH